MDGCPTTQRVTNPPSLPTLLVRGGVPGRGVDFGHTFLELSAFRHDDLEGLTCFEWYCGRRPVSFFLCLHGRYGSLSLSPAASQASTLTSRLRVRVIGFLHPIVYLHAHAPTCHPPQNMFEASYARLR